MIPGLLQFDLCKKMLLFFYPVLCKPCKWCAIKTIYKQKDVHTELFKADSFAGKYNITECSVCFSCCGVSELKYFRQIIWRDQDIIELFHTVSSLVTPPKIKRQPNPTELRLMDSYIQILCRFQKSKRKFPPPSLLCTKKKTLYQPGHP